MPMRSKDFKEELAELRRYQQIADDKISELDKAIEKLEATIKEDKKEIDIKAKKIQDLNGEKASETKKLSDELSIVKQALKFAEQKLSVSETELDKLRKSIASLQTIPAPTEAPKT